MIRQQERHPPAGRTGDRTGGPSPALECRRLAVSYGSARVLEGVDLRVEGDEVLAVLGPSGSGKTTLLHAVAGFLRPVAGEVWIGGRLVATARASDPPERRGIGMVFQHYALWPHMRVLDVVAYPIRRAGVPRDDARVQAMALLTRLRVEHLADRRPAELSGGEQQRVGLARALARRAGLYLFDEPTAHLDAALRAVFQQEVAERRREAGAAAVYATHDAAEALGVAHRVALLRDGRIVQTGTPLEVYERPVDLWAALLTGPASIVRCSAAPDPAGPGRVRMTVLGRGLSAAGDLATAGGGDVEALLRPEWASLGQGPLQGLVRTVSYRGPHTDYTLETEVGPIVVREAQPPRLRVGRPTPWTIDRIWVPDGGGLRTASSPDPDGRPARS